MKPRRRETFALLTDPCCAAKVHVVVGLHMHSPDREVVQRVGDKSPIQVLTSSQRALPLSFGQPRARAQGYLHHGAATLSAALDVYTGEVISKLRRRYRTREFLACLHEICRQVPEEFDVQMIMGDFAAHETEQVRAWFAAGPKSVPKMSTAASWPTGRTLLRADLRALKKMRFASQHPRTQGLDLCVPVEIQR